MSPDFFVLSGPQGSGKSRHAAEIARLLGATSIVDEWDGVSPVPAGALALTSNPHPDFFGTAPQATNSEAA